MPFYSAKTSSHEENVKSYFPRLLWLYVRKNTQLKIRNNLFRSAHLSFSDCMQSYGSQLGKVSHFKIVNFAEIQLLYKL